MIIMALLILYIELNTCFFTLNMNKGKPLHNFNLSSSVISPFVSPFWKTFYADFGIPRIFIISSMLIYSFDFDVMNTFE